MNILEKVTNITQDISSLSDLEGLVISLGITLLQKIGSALALIIVLIIIRKIGTKLIKKAFALKIDKLDQVSGATNRRKVTMERLLLNIWRYTINIIGFISVIGIFVNTTSLLASAGFLTVIITFASQSLLGDVVKGFFIIFEDQFSVGDFVEINSYTGTVLEIGLRSSKLQLVTGEVVIIPNSDINNIINYSVTKSKALLDIGIPYEADLEKVLDILENIADKALEKYPEIIARPMVMGVQSLENSQVVVRMLAEVETGQKAYIERELRKKIKLTFDQEGIEMPFPRMVIYQQDKKGVTIGE